MRRGGMKGKEGLHNGWDMGTGSNNGRNGADIVVGADTVTSTGTSNAAAKNSGVYTDTGYNTGGHLCYAASVPRCDCGAECTVSNGAWVCPACGLVQEEPVLSVPTLSSEHSAPIENTAKTPSGATSAKIMFLSHKVCAAARLPQSAALEIARTAARTPRPPKANMMLHVLAAAIRVTNSMGGKYVRTTEEWKHIIEKIELLRTGRAGQNGVRPISYWDVLNYIKSAYGPRAKAAWPKAKPKLELESDFESEPKSEDELEPEVEVGVRGGAELEIRVILEDAGEDAPNGGQSHYWERLRALSFDPRAVARASYILPRPKTLNQAIAALLLVGGRPPEGLLAEASPDAVKKAMKGLPEERPSAKRLETLRTLASISESLGMPPGVEREAIGLLSRSGALGKTAAAAALYVAAEGKEYRLRQEWELALRRAGIRMPLYDLLDCAKKKTRLFKPNGASAGCQVCLLRLQNGARAREVEKIVARLGEILGLREGQIRHAVRFLGEAVNAGRLPSTPLITALASLTALDFIRVTDPEVKKRLADAGVRIGHKRPTDIRAKWVERAALELKDGFIKNYGLGWVRGEAY